MNSHMILTRPVNLSLDGEGRVLLPSGAEGYMAPVVTKCARLARQETHNSAAGVPLTSSIAGSLSLCISC